MTDDSIKALLAENAMLRALKESYEQDTEELWVLSGHTHGDLKKVVANLRKVYDAAKQWRHATDSPRQFPQSLDLEKAIDEARAYEGDAYAKQRKPEDPFEVCTTCGNPRQGHNYRHVFTTQARGKIHPDVQCKKCGAPYGNHHYKHPFQV